MQGAVVALYKRFLESPNFAAWFERQREGAWAWQEAEWAAAAAVRGEGADLSGLDEVQVCCLSAPLPPDVLHHRHRCRIVRESHHT